MSERSYAEQGVDRRVFELEAKVEQLEGWKIGVDVGIAELKRDLAGARQGADILRTEADRRGDELAKANVRAAMAMECLAESIVLLRRLRSTVRNGEPFATEIDAFLAKVTR